MKSFEYAAPRTEADVVALLNEHAGTATILAGGTDLVGLMKKMVETPDRVINIMEIDSLKSVDPIGNAGVRIGAAMTLDDVIEHPLVKPYSALTDGIRRINSMQLLCQGTLGGELLQRPRCWYYRDGSGLMNDRVADGENSQHAIFDNQGRAKFVSASRIAPLLIAMQASVRVVGSDGAESYRPVEALFQTPRRDGQRENTLGDAELVTHIIVPDQVGWMSGSYEVRQNCGPDFPLAAAACSFVHAGGVVQEARIVMGHVAPAPRSSQDAADFLRGKVIDEAVADAAGEVAVRKATPLSQNGHKVQLAKVAVKRAILSAAGLETGGL
jgi:xanthine dehydrogenase YagS FAD-binding subunit